MTTIDLGDVERVDIKCEEDIVTARQVGRQLAITIGFTGSEPTLIATAISEVARNIVSYACPGEVVLRPISSGGRCGIEIVASDHGPGIADIALALQDGYTTTARSLGLGLPGAKRLMDHMEITSAPGQGTVVRMRRLV